MQLTLAKYHGLGNDFLVLVDRERALPVDGSLAAALCDRHRGVGADGLVRLSVPAASGAPTPGADLRFELWNADGGVAETSGNGLRCAALAAVHAGLAAGPELTVDTLAGPTRLVVDSGPEAGAARVRVAMGTVSVGPEQPASELPSGAAAELADRWARHVDVGNPHVVIYRKAGSEGPAIGTAGSDGTSADGAAPALDLARIGAEIESRTPGGVNVEVVAVPSDDRLLLRVWERGAGLTLACGSGSCASAAAARASGLAGDVVKVENPGGTLTVELGGDLLHPVAMLTGPARRIATVQVETDELDGLAAPSRPAGSAAPEAALAAPGRP